MGFEEIFESTAFWILSVVGYLAFVMMLMILKGMGNANIMPWWVKIATIIVIPLAAAVFSGYAES